MAVSTYLNQKEDEINQQCEMNIRAEETTRDQRINQADKMRPKKDKDSTVLLVIAALIGIICWIAMHSFVAGFILWLVVYFGGLILRNSLDSLQNRAVDKEIEDIKNNCAENIRRLKSDKEQQIAEVPYVIIEKNMDVNCSKPKDLWILFGLERIFRGKQV